MSSAAGQPDGEWITKLPSPERIPIGSQLFTKHDLSTLNSSVVPLVVATRETIHCVGTAFCISSIGLWITARHVLEGRGGAIELRDSIPGSSLAIFWIGSSGGQLTGGTIPIKFFTRHPPSGSDLALLRTRAAKFNFPSLALNAELPTAGMPIIGAGYPKFEVSPWATGEPGRLALTPNMHSSSGEVVHLYKEGRDTFRDLDGNYTGKLPTVCYETSARFDAGMSGGPVLNPYNVVCGVISTGFAQSQDGNTEETSFASATPYIFMLKMPYGKDNEKRITVYELAKRGYVPTDESLERLRLIEDGNEIHLYYDAPEQPKQTTQSHQ